MWALNTCGEPNEIELTIRVLTGDFTPPFPGLLRQARAAAVRLTSRSISPPWGSIRFRLAPRTYDAPPWGVRVVSQTKSRKIPTRNILPLFSLSRYDMVNEQGIVGCGQMDKTTRAKLAAIAREAVPGHGA